MIVIFHIIWILLLQTLIIYCVGRIASRLIVGDWYREHDHIVYYIGGCFIVITLLLILAIPLWIFT